ncbi:translocation/assembly module TamB, partial [bacterium]|nr:translocation/assembly module TamB [bacterium]
LEDKISGWAQGQFFGLQLEHFAQIPGWLCGSFSVEGEGPPWETAAITAQVSLRHSSIDKYAIQRANVHLEGTLADFSCTGDIYTNVGNADMTFHSRDFQSSSPYLEGQFNLQNIHVQAFVPDMPDDFPRLSGSVRGEVRGFQPESSEGMVDVQLMPTAYRQIVADTISLSAQWKNQKLSLSHLWASYKGTSIYAHGSGYLDSTIYLHTELDIHEVSEVMEKLPLPDDFSGVITGDVQVSADAHFRIDTSGLSDLEASAEIRAHALTYDSAAVQDLIVSINTFRLSPVFASGELIAEGGRFADYFVDSLRLSFAGRPDSLALKLFTSVYGDSLRVQMEGIFTQSKDEEVAGDVQALDVEIFDDRWLLEKPSSFVYHQKELSLTDFKMRSDAGVVQAAGKLAMEGTQDFTLTLSEFSVKRFEQFLPFLDGDISARVYLSGDAKSLQANFDVLAESLQWAENDWIDRLSVTGKLQGNSLAADGICFWHSDTLFAFRGEIPMSLSYDSGAVIAKEEAMSAHLHVYGQLLSKLQPYLPWGVTVGGWAGAEVEVSGTFTKPVWYGEVTVKDASVKDVVHGLYYDKIELRGTLDEDSLFIERMDARATGKVHAEGHALMAFPLPKDLGFHADFKGFRILNRPDIRARISGDVDIEGPLLGLQAKGDITLEKLRYRITSATTKSIEEVDLESELATLRGDTVATFRVPGMLIYDKMDQALRVTLPRNCWVHGGGISIELEGDVWLYKAPNEAEQVYGQIRVVRGTVSLYTRKLKIQEGTITFDGDPLDPNLDITAIEANLKRVRDVEITLKLTGTKNHPEIELSGQDPDGELTYEDIVSYLMFGRRASGGSTLASQESESSTLGETAATGLSAGVSGLVSRTLGLDVFEYRPSSEGLTQGELEVGTYVTDNLFVSIIQSMEEAETGQEVILEYQLLPWLRLQGTREAHGHSGFDLFFHWEWR